MNFIIRGENIEVTPALRSYVEKKVGRLDRYFSDELSSDVYVTLKVIRDMQSVEVTIPIPKLLLRAEEKHEDMYASIDLVIEKLERQIRKHKTKLNRRLRTDNTIKQAYFNPTPEDASEEDMEIVRIKRFNLKPMDPEEAVLQMDLLGHNFFVFNDSVEGTVSVVYKRKDGRYGLIQPE
jgi:putative sigma-54 modulation protein